MSPTRSRRRSAEGQWGVPLLQWTPQSRVKAGGGGILPHRRCCRRRHALEEGRERHRQTSCRLCTTAIAP